MDGWKSKNVEKYKKIYIINRIRLVGYLYGKI